MVVVAGQPWRDVEDRSWSRCCHSLLPFAFSSSSSSSPFCTVIVGIHKTVSPAHSCDAQRGVQFRLVMCCRGRETMAGKQGGIVELVASCSLTIRVCKYCLFAVPFQSMLHATWCLSNSSSSSSSAAINTNLCHTELFATKNAATTLEARHPNNLHHLSKRYHAPRKEIRAHQRVRQRTRKRWTSAREPRR